MATMQKHRDGKIAPIENSREGLAFLAQNMTDIVWTVDLELRTTYVSPSVEQVLGFTPEQRKRQRIEEMLTPRSLQLAPSTCS